MRRSPRTESPLAHSHTRAARFASRASAAPRCARAHRYALTAHMTEDETAPWARLALFRQWGYFWDLSKPVLLEKSPPNMVISRMLEALWSRHGLGAPRGVVFVFITRHPIANALGHLQWNACKGMSVFELVTHWVAQHDTLAADLPKLARATLLKLEEWSADPEPALARIFEGLGLAEPPPAEAARAAAAGVRANPNAKYESQYCADLQFAARRAAHGRLVEKLGERVAVHGYDLDSFGGCAHSRAPSGVATATGAAAGEL